MEAVLLIRTSETKLRESKNAFEKKSTNDKGCMAIVQKLCTNAFAVRKGLLTGKIVLMTDFWEAGKSGSEIKLALKN